MKTLLVGATGLLGTGDLSAAREAGHQVRALIRPTADPAKRAALVGLGVELVEGDLKDPASLARACAGVQAVISTASSTLRVRRAIRLRPLTNRPAGPGRGRARVQASITSFSSRFAKTRIFSSR